MKAIKYIFVEGRTFMRTGTLQLNPKPSISLKYPFSIPVVRRCYTMMGCRKCRTLCGFLMLVFGAIFLLKDLGQWDFWGINWWTVLFLLWGIGSLGMASCPDCQAMMKKK